MKLRRTLIYVNGNDTEKIDAAIKSNVDVIVLDLEDGVPMSVKDEARGIIVDALKNRNFRNKERAVRINHLDTAESKKDLEAILPARPDAIRLPKCESVEYVLRLDRILGDFEKANGMPENSIEIILMIETAVGLLHSYEMASCCKRVTAMGIGMEDMTANLGIKRHYELGSHDLLYVRQQLIVNAVAAGVQPIDACVLFNGNLEYVLKDSENSCRDGFVGRSVYDAAQIDVINQAFSPCTEEVEWSHRIIDAYEEGCRKGIAEIRVDGIYVDPPVVMKAERILGLMDMIELRRKA